MSKMDEIILVVPREDVFAKETLTFQGVETNENRVEKIMTAVAEKYTIMRRGDAEENPAFKQPIPYCVIRRGNEIFLYKRLSGGGEARLHDKLSIGAGGHMNDANLPTFQDILDDNLSRELEEELIITTESREFSFIGLINDDENEVGKVHLGVLVVLDIDGDVDVRETEQLAGEWVTVESLLKDYVFAKLESWSQIAAKALV